MVSHLFLDEDFQVGYYSLLTPWQTHTIFDKTKMGLLIRHSMSADTRMIKHQSSQERTNV